MPQLATEAAQLRAVIHEFLQERLQAKLDKLKEGDDEKRQQLVEAYQPQNWIPDAARRVGQIQQITHALKYIHPEAKGTNLNSPGNAAAGESLVGTHTIADQCAYDVVGNAAALDVYKFLRLAVNDKTLLSRSLEHDPALQHVFSENNELAMEWMIAFSGLVASKGEPASHKLAKQIYWPMRDGEYHLLAPLFPTSLVHKVWSSIREDRFSDQAKEARDARKAGKRHPSGYHEYPNVVIQQFGGTKPQNISQLNSERYGENQLLPSCPPNWASEAVKPPLRVDSVFDVWFGRRARVRTLTASLRDFLYSLPADKTNIRIRNTRKKIVANIVDELLVFAAELRDLTPGWSLHEECRLNINEACWLDPFRAEVDEAFSAAYLNGGWKDYVHQRFANWLNAQLTKKKKSLHLGENEATQWAVDFDVEHGPELRMMRDELAIDIPVHSGFRENRAMTTKAVNDD